MCVCVYMYIYIYIYTHKHTHTHAVDYYSVIEKNEILLPAQHGWDWN